MLAQARDAFLPALSQAFTAAVTRFDDVLFDRAENAGASQLVFLDGMRELRRRREEIISRFRAQMEISWQSLEQGTPLSAEAALSGQPAGGAGLSLVPEHELESRLAVRNLASVLLRECKPVLAHLDRRLGWIAGGMDLNADTDPIAPEHIGVAIHEAFATSDLAPEVRLVLIKLCERDLSEPICRLYAQLDELLAKAGVMPEISAAAPRAAALAAARGGRHRGLQPRQRGRIRRALRAGLGRPFRQSLGAKPWPHPGRAARSRGRRRRRCRRRRGASRWQPGHVARGAARTAAADAQRPR